MVSYAEEKLRNLEAILEYALPDELKNSSQTAFEAGCAVDINDGNYDRVYRLLLENSQKLGLDEERQKCRDLVWGKLSAIKSSDRQDRFRVCSNANGMSAKETFNTTVVLNPDPWLYSYNFPWHIISWLQDIHNRKEPTYSLRYDDHQEEIILDKKFIYKYLWMLATDDVLPIFSLRSFLNLRPFFKEIQPDFYKLFSIGSESSGEWVLSFEDFKPQWTELSKLIVEKITGEKELNPKLREILAIFLMVVSLADKPVQDIGDSEL